jgi:hypothetical protein
MSDILIHSEIRDIMSRLRWLQRREGMPCHETRYVALCKALGLLNKAKDQSRFTVSRGILFRLINEAKREMEYSLKGM